VSRITIRDIARLSGFSKTTVSFAFNEPSRIGSQTRETILRIAEELGYIPDPAARNLSLKRRGTIGLLLPDVISDAFYNPYMAQIVRGIGEVCEREGHSLTLIPPIHASLMEGIRNAAVDGLITLGLEPGMEAVGFIQRRALPFVAIDGRSGGEFPVVGIDDCSAAAGIMEHVLDLGHVEIAIIGFGPEPLLSTGSHVTSERLKGYHAAIKAAGHEMSESIQYFTAKPSLDGGRAAARQILSETRRPTAVVAMSDIIAIGAMGFFQAHGISVPRDITVVGFDDIPETHLVRPGLTTVSQPGYEKGLVAADALVTMINGDQPEAHIVLVAQLSLRDSSGFSSRPLPAKRSVIGTRSELGAHSRQRRDV
jgi:DNA-binding LacI/PurR family transcriptional regulator